MTDTSSSVARPGDLRIAVLGPPLIEADGEPISMDTRKAVALLAYLALSGRRARRDALGFLLWPDTSQQRARAALRRTLSTLRKAIGAERLVTDRETVELDLSDAAIDVELFRIALEGCPSHAPTPDPSCARCLDAVGRGTALYRGDLLAGFSLRDSAEFDDWQLAEADSLRIRYASALQLLTDGATASGDLEGAKAHARRWLAVDPLNEGVHRRLMLLHAWTDDRSAALRQYRQCTAILDRELGVTALAETTELYHAIREGDAPPPPRAVPVAPEPSSPSAPAVRPGDVPFVGREAEVAALLQAWQDTGPDGRLAVVEGEAGVGKTRLVEEVLERIRSLGGHVIETRCHEDESSLAFGPVVELLAAAAEEPAVGRLPPERLAEAARLLPELASGRGLPSPAPLDSPGAQARFYEGLGLVLRTAGGTKGPTAIFVDDLHWADEASLDVLVYLAHRLAGRPVLLVGAWRTELVGEAHRLRRASGNVLRSGLAVHVSLERLPRSAVLELVRRVLPHEPADVGERLFERTEGLPLFCIEYLAASGMGGETPAGVRELLRSRLRPLSEPSRQVLTTAAVIGRSFDLATVRGASGRSDEEVVVALEELTAHGLLAEGEEGSYDFTHPSLITLLYDEISLARRRLLHRRVADALQGAGRHRHGGIAALVAAHLAQAGASDEAAEQYRVAGEHARALYANAEALTHFRRALALGHPDASGLHETIAGLLTLVGDYRGALESYEAAAAMAPDPTSLARIEHHLGLLHQRLGDHAAADSYFAAALAAPVEEAGWRSRLLADRGLSALQRDDLAAASEMAHEAQEIAHAGGDPRALAQALNILGMVARRRGDPDEACERLEASLSTAASLAEPSARIAALNNLALAEADRGALERALTLTEEALELCAALGDRHREAALHSNMADLLRAAGREDEAMARLKRAARTFSQIGEPDVLQPEIWKLVDW